jgi:hypothetical protein
VGTRDGENVGKDDGLSVGVEDGTGVGGGVGAVEGERDGAGEGGRVGSGVGSGTGWDVGAGKGTLVGLGNGESEGGADVVGREVGLFLNFPSLVQNTLLVVRKVPLRNFPCESSILQLISWFTSGGPVKDTAPQEGLAKQRTKEVEANPELSVALSTTTLPRKLALVAKEEES